MPLLHLISAGDVLYEPHYRTGMVTQIDVLEVDRLSRRVRARYGFAGTRQSEERWMIETEITRLRRSPPGARKALQLRAG